MAWSSSRWGVDGGGAPGGREPCEQRWERIVGTVGNIRFFTRALGTSRKKWETNMDKQVGGRGKSWRVSNLG